MKNKKQLKVLVLLPFFDLGGAEKQGYYIAKSLQESGLYDVEVWSLEKGSGLLIEKIISSDLKYKVLNILFSSFHNRVSRLKVYFEFFLQLKKSKIDVIIPFTYHCNIISASTFRFAGVKKCLWFQIQMEYEIPLSFFEKLAVKFKPVYAANSLAAADYIKKKYSISSKITFIPNPFEKLPFLNSKEYWLNKLNYKEEEIIMVMVANFFPEKDHNTLLEGLKKLLLEFPKLKLVFAGNLFPSANSNALKACAFDLGLNGHVIFLGSVKDIPGLLNTADIGILSSRSEGSPNSIIEYMGYGLPIIATDIPAISELLGKEYPYLFKVEDVEDFVIKTRHLIHNIDKIGDLIDKNKKNVADIYSVESNYNAFHNLIKN